MPNTEVTYSVGFIGDVDELKSIAAAHGMTCRKTLVPTLYELKGPSSKRASHSLQGKLNAHPHVLHVDPVMILHARLIPNDPNYTNGNEWHLNGKLLYV